MPDRWDFDVPSPREQQFVRQVEIFLEIVGNDKELLPAYFSGWGDRRY
jgi:hypothetical protein